jgi:hypothetical protein
MRDGLSFKQEAIQCQPKQPTGVTNKFKALSEGQKK